MGAPTFSPVTTVVPMKSPKGKNITGYPRHIRDLTAAIHENVQEWNSHHLDGLSVMEHLVREKHDESYSQELQEHCDRLEVVCDKLDGVVQNLATIAHQMKVTSTRICDNRKKLFATWPNFKFGQVAELIHDAYSREAEVKHKILEDVAHHSAESWKMLFLACWAHQPLLSNDLTTALESMLIETGHR